MIYTGMRVLPEGQRLSLTIQYSFMIVEDQRNISCGGDPFNYLKSVMKALYFQLDPGQDAKILLLKEKFPYSRNVFDGMARTTRLRLLDMEEASGEVHLTVRKESQ